ncbi:hypothetical protein ACL2XG_07015 [Sodalis sp. RH24]|uniref:hypothetical protein n=1 Tax=unclassified Sodalis (in: enterobacteria) TaxID=2636512 RepID=UPI0039B3DC51
MTHTLICHNRVDNALMARCSAGTHAITHYLSSPSSTNRTNFLLVRSFFNRTLQMTGISGICCGRAKCPAVNAGDIIKATAMEGEDAPRVGTPRTALHQELPLSG